MGFGRNTDGSAVCVGRLKSSIRTILPRKAFRWWSVQATCRASLQPTAWRGSPSTPQPGQTGWKSLWVRALVGVSTVKCRTEVKSMAWLCMSTASFIHSLSIYSWWWRPKSERKQERTRGHSRSVRWQRARPRMYTAHYLWDRAFICSLISHYSHRVTVAYN